jgi:hypothetical protein
MKVYQIISEAPSVPPGYTTSPSGLIVPIQPATPAPATTGGATTPAKPTPTPKQVAQNKVDRVKARAKNLGKDKGIFAKNDIRNWKNKKIEQIWDGLKSTETKKGLEKYNKFIESTAGKVLVNALRAAGIAIIAKDYYTVTGQIEEWYENGDIDDTTVSGQTAEQTFRNWINQANGMLSVQLSVFVVQALADIKIAAQVAKGIIRVAGLSSAGATLGASVAALLVTEAGFLALEKMLTTETGKQWFANKLLLPLITGVGSIQSASWDYMTDYFEKQNLKRSDKALQSKLATATTPQEKAAITQAINAAKTAADEVAARRAAMSNLK